MFTINSSIIGKFINQKGTSKKLVVGKKNIT